MCPAKIEKIVHIGSFIVSDGKIVAADPCRKTLEGRGHAFFNNCAAGLWHAFVEDDGADTYKLIAIFSGAEPQLSDWTISLGDSVSVVSGQAGIFDCTRYHFDQAFYEKICDLTLRSLADPVEGKQPGLEAWCFDWGAVSGTATGDDNFLCYTMVDADGISVGVAIYYYHSYTEWKDINLSKILVSVRER